MMSILIITSLFCPVVNAEPAPVIAAAAAPEIAEVVIAGITVVMSGIAALKIAENLGVTWDGAADSWDTFVKSVSTELEKVFAQQWVKTANHKGKESMNAVYDYYTALGSPKGKDDKWYFEARQNHGKVEVNMKQLTEEQAVKKMEEGKDIMTLDQKLATDVLTRFKDAGKGRKIDLNVEGAHHETAGYFDHLHYGRNANERLHCWIWKKV